MTTSEVKRLPKSTIEIEITIPWEDIKGTYEKVMEDVVKGAEIQGFRKGKAPRKMVEERVDKTKLYEEVIKEIVPKAYAESVQKNSLKPIISPRVEVLHAKENEDWKIKATVAEKPEVNLKNYKDTISGLRAKKSLWVPGKDESGDKEKKDLTLDEVLEALLKEVIVEIPDILVEEEVNRMLSRLIDETHKLGLTVEQYLMAKGKTTDQIRQEYRMQAENTLKLEFILEAITDNDKIQVTDREIDEAISKVKDEADRVKLKKDSYYLASLLRRQKTLDSLLKPIV